MAGVDDDRAGGRMDQALLSLAARSDRSARELVCTGTLATARLLRLERLGRLELAADLGRPEPEVRQIAVMQVIRKRDRSALPQVRDLIRDSQLPVASAAMRALVALGDRDSIRTLELLSIDPDQARLHGMACHALWDLGVTDACGGRPRQEEAGGLLGTLSGGQAAEDPCASARRDLKSDEPAKVEAALIHLLVDRFVALSTPLDPVRSACVNCAEPEVCRLPVKTTRRIARRAPSWTSALASAVLLLKDWPTAR